ncbi:MAG TPA: ATP-binding protein [Chloroflexia bacterium]|nr:ATP-binding protein [Chloroflexia bacterium]
MAELANFREKVREYRLLVSRTQTQLADYLNLDYTELSNRLNATKKARLSHANVRAIIRALAEWGAISTQAQACELLDLMNTPYFEEVDWQAPPLSRLKASTPAPTTETEDRLRVISTSPSPLIKTRLADFVGRVRELQEIKEWINRFSNTGGYLTISGPAGQGKSSLVARLISDYSTRAGDYSQVIHHFIPLNPGPDHQVSLLRDLLAQLVLKYHLPEFYVSSESRPALRDFFRRALQEVAAKPGLRQEVIFIDGLDQLEDEPGGMRDLSFLPPDVPAGIVFVLGTRPNDTLKPLKLLKPFYEYRLPALSRPDFDLLLSHYNLSPSRALADQFYETLGHNALYLNLVARQLAGEAEKTTKSDVYHGTGEEIIGKLADDPDRLFSLAFERLKKFRDSWREVIRPLCGILLVAQEPLGQLQLRELVGVDASSLRDGLIRLGGLVAYDENERVYLFHLKLKDYLRQDAQRPAKDYLFALDEEQSWHAHLARWCLAALPETSMAPSHPANSDPVKKQYALQHYLKHLAGAGDWETVCKVLDQGEFVRAKLTHSHNIASYARDLELGRQAATMFPYPGGVNYLAQLWRYSLLRCKLADWTARSHLSILGFEIITSQTELNSALGLVEVLTVPQEKLKVLLEQVHKLEEQGPKAQETQAIWVQKVLERAYKVVGEIAGEEERLLAVLDLFKTTDRWNIHLLSQSEELIQSFERVVFKGYLLQELSTNLYRQGQTGEAARLKTMARSLTAGTGMASDPKFVLGKLKRQKKTVHHKQVRGVEEDRLKSFLVEKLGAVGQWEDAYHISTSIDNSLLRASSLLTLAQHLLASVENRSIQAYLDEAQLLLTQSDSSNEEREDGLLRQLALMFGEIGEAERAFELLRIIVNASEKVSGLANLALQFNRAGQLELSERAWQMAQAAISDISSRNLKAYLLGELVQTYCQATKWEVAERIVEQIEIPYLKLVSLAELITNAAKAGYSGVTEYLKKALNLTEKLVTPRERTVGLRSLAVALVWGSGSEQAIEIVAKIPNSTEKARALRAVALELLAKNGNSDYGQAYRIIESIGYSFQQALGLCSIATLLLQDNGRLNQVEELVNRVQTLEERLPVGQERVEVTLALAGLELKLGRYKQVSARAASLPADLPERTHLLKELVDCLREAGKPEAALQLVQESWQGALSTTELYQRFPLVSSFLENQPALGLEIYHSFRLVVDFSSILPFYTEENRQ